MSHQALILTNFSISYQNKNDDDQLYEINYKDTSDFFEDGFSSPWLKSSMVLVYLINCLSNGGLCFVVWFEVTGRAGPYRTLVNKLVSFMIVQVSSYKKNLILLLLRIWNDSQVFVTIFLKYWCQKIVPICPDKQFKFVQTSSNIINLVETCLIFSLIFKLDKSWLFSTCQNLSKLVKKYILFKT